jgi:integrase
MKLGSYPGVSLKQARELAEIEIGRAAGGEDPLKDREEVRAAGGGLTVAEVAQEYLERHARVVKRKAGYQMDRWQLSTYILPQWGKRPIGEVSHKDVRDLLEAVASGELTPRGQPTRVAPRAVRALLSKLFHWAADQEYLAANPAAGVKLPAAVCEHLKKGGRDRVLSDLEITALGQELDRVEAQARARGLAPVAAAALRLILLTAQRPGEVMAMRWRDFEDGEWWVVPAQVAKNGHANRVYLSPPARRVLQELRPHTGESEWVLESPVRPGTHLTTLKNTLRGIARRCPLPPWTPHDLRRTAASKMRALGVSRLTVQAILNHKDRSVTAVYDRYGADPEKREALTRWGRRVEEISQGERETGEQAEGGAHPPRQRQRPGP